MEQLKIWKICKKIVGSLRMNPISQGKSYMMTEHNCGSKSQYNEWTGNNNRNRRIEVKYNTRILMTIPTYTNEEITRRHGEHVEINKFINRDSGSHRSDCQLRAKYDTSTLINIKGKMEQWKNNAMESKTQNI